MTRGTRWMGWVLLLAAACGGKAVSEAPPPPEKPSCRVGDLRIAPGTTFPAGDGCNDCFCTAHGVANCTKRVCPVTQCEFEGKSYELGEAFLAPDGCNSCTCERDGVACTERGCAGGCMHQGVSYPVGASFPLDCNTCTCRSDGQFACTQIGCAPRECTYLGRTYAPGATFPARDGCNTCECYGDGSAGCTERGCPCKPEAEWWARYVLLGSCAAVDFVCPEFTTAFVNGCGCGCAQDVRCPELIDCAGDDCGCPYSQRRE